MTSSGKSGSSCLMPGVVDAGHVVGGEHPDDARHVVRRRGVERRDQRVGVRRLDRPGVQHVPGPQRPGRRCRAPRPSRAARRSRACSDWPDDGVRRAARTGHSCGASLPVVEVRASEPRSRAAYSRSSAWPSIAERYAALARWSPIGVPSVGHHRRRVRGRSGATTAGRRGPPPSRRPGSAWPRRRRARWPPVARRRPRPRARSPTATLEMSSKRRFAIFWNAVTGASGSGIADRADQLARARTLCR